MYIDTCIIFIIPLIKSMLSGKLEGSVNMKKSFRWLALLLVMAMLLAACGGSGNEAGSTEASGTDAAGTDVGPETTEAAGSEATGGEVTTGGKYLRTNNSSEPGSLDPALAQGTHDSWILQHVFERLMTYDQEGNLVPGMAKEEPVISEDGLTYTFTLKDDIKWSNGEPVTAQDFEFSWKRVADPELAADYAYQLYYIEGMEEFNTGEDLNGDGKVATWDDLGVKALDDKTLEVKLVAPTGFFTELTAFYTYSPVNKANVEANPNWANSPENYVCNGPFKLARWDHNQKIILDKNPEYYNADAVKIDGIDMDVLDDDNTSYQKYDGGEYDLVVKMPPAVTGEKLATGDPELVLGPQVGTYYYNFNHEVPPFNNPKVRQAFALALDREVITRDISKGGEVPAEGIVPFGLLDENGKEYRDSMPNAISFDPAKAKQLLDEGLAEEGMDVSVFSNMTILFNTSEAHRIIAQVAQQMWREHLGVEIGLENVEFQVKLDREKAGDYQISRAGWIGDYADPLTMLDLWYSTSSYNDANYNNPEYDAFIDTARGTGDQKARFDAMRKAEKMMTDDMVVCPVYFYTLPYLVKPNIEGVYKTLLNYPTLTYVEIK